MAKVWLHSINQPIDQSVTHLIEFAVLVGKQMWLFGHPGWKAQVNDVGKQNLCASPECHPVFLEQTLNLMIAL